MKVAERVLERRLRQAVEIDKMQFGFRPGTGTTHAEVGWHSWRAEYIPGFMSLHVLLMMAFKSLFFSNLFLIYGRMSALSSLS